MGKSRSNSSFRLPGSDTLSWDFGTELAMMLRTFFTSRTVMLPFRNSRYTRARRASQGSRCGSSSMPYFALKSLFSCALVDSGNGGLQSCFVAANVSTTWATEFVKQHRIDTLEDFCYLVRSTEWEQSLEDLVRGCPSLKDNRIAVARFKAAYETGMQAIRQVSQVAKASPEAMDERSEV